MYGLLDKDINYIINTLIRFLEIDEQNNLYTILMSYLLILTLSLYGFLYNFR